MSNFQELFNLNPKKIKFWSLKDVKNWLNFLDLIEYFENFEKNNIYGDKLINFKYGAEFFGKKEINQNNLKVFQNWSGTLFNDFDRYYDELNFDFSISKLNQGINSNLFKIKKN